MPPIAIESDEGDQQGILHKARPRSASLTIRVLALT